MDIQKATLEQLIPLNNLFDQYRRFYDKSSNLKKANNFLKNESSERNQRYIFLGKEIPQLGSFNCFLIFINSSSRYWLLNDLYVHPNYRGEGISKALIEQAKQLCRDTSACGMYLETGMDNNIAHLISSNGF